LTVLHCTPVSTPNSMKVRWPVPIRRKTSWIMPSSSFCENTLAPFTSSALDQILRNMGVTTVIATGNSVNIGILGVVISAVDLGYQVVVPRDAVAGVPQSYADAVLDNTIAMLATVTTTDEIIAAWS